MDILVERYLAAWNETDADRRTGLIQEIFAEDATYQDPLMNGQGHAGIDGLIVAVQNRFPRFVFRSEGAVDTVGDSVRFSWAFGSKEGKPVAGGTDFAEVDDKGRFVRVVGFLDPVETA